MNSIIRYIAIFGCMLLSISVNAQQINAYEYFLDTDPGIGQANYVAVTPADSVDINFTVDLSAVTKGIHNLYVRVLGDTVTSFTHIKPFVVTKTPYQPNIVKAEYFFDTDPGYGEATAISVTEDDSVEMNLVIPLSDVSVGIHNLFVRVQDNNDEWSTISNHVFYTEITEGNDELKQVEYFIDTDPGFGEGTHVALASSDSTEVKFTVDLSDLNTGVHNLYVRVQNQADEWSVIDNRVFYVDDVDVDATINYAEYFVDEDPGIGEGTEIAIDNPADSISLTFTADLSSLEIGTHSMSVRVRDENYKWSIAQTDTFQIADPEATDITTEDGDHIKIYPNPVVSDLYVSIPTLNSDAVIKLYDLHGKLIYTEEVLEQSDPVSIDMSSYSSGVYFVQIKSKEISLMKKIIKK